MYVLFQQIQVKRLEREIQHLRHELAMHDTLVSYLDNQVQVRSQDFSGSGRDVKWFSGRKGDRIQTES